MEHLMQDRHRFKQSVSLKDRLSAFINAMRERAELVGPGPERDGLLEKVRKAENAVEIDGWANSPNLHPPT